MQEKSFVTQAGDSHFKQNSDKSAAKSWQLQAMMEDSMPNQLCLVTEHYIQACMRILLLLIIIHCLYLENKGIVSLSGCV